MKFSAYTVRDWVYVALFGALWGTLEITLGAYLHVIFPPLANTFFSGLVMAGMGVVVALVGSYFVPRTGAVLSIGIITALLKAVSLGGVKVGPMVAILAEAVLMEVALLLKRVPASWRYVLAGSLAVSWNLPHKFVMMRLLYGKGFTEVYLQMIREGSQLLGLDMGYAVAIIGAPFVVRLVVGAGAGWLAWELAGLVARRMGRE